MATTVTVDGNKASISATGDYNVIVDANGGSLTISPTNGAIRITGTINPDTLFLALDNDAGFNYGGLAIQTGGWVWRYDSASDETIIYFLPNADGELGEHALPVSDTPASNSIIYITGNPYDAPEQATIITDRQTVKTQWPNSPPSYASYSYVCFLPGTLIETRNGAKPIETLSEQDLVLTISADGTRYYEAPRALLSARHTVQSHLPPDIAGYPVRVVQNALAPGVPSQDLLITPEHCFFFDSHFIPVRMLVNGSTIRYDKTIVTYDYHHIETEKHTVIIANNTPTESYLDTGHRMPLRLRGTVMHLPRRPAGNWREDAAHPLVTDRGTVEPLYRQLLHRACTLGLPPKVRPDVTREPDLYLLLDNGTPLRPFRHTITQAVFRLPAEKKAAWIMSRADRPCDAVGPFLDDRRQLGVLVGAITLFAPAGSTGITHHLNTPDLPGWDVTEQAPCRWTNGRAYLPLPPPTHPGDRLLAIEIITAGPYRLSSLPDVTIIRRTA